MAENKLSKKKLEEKQLEMIWEMLCQQELIKQCCQETANDILDVKAKTENNN